jgi:methylornithine synthase
MATASISEGKDARSSLDGVQELIGRSSLQHLLQLPPGPEMDLLFSMARNVRERHWGNAIFLYGFVYFSNHCRNRCAFCGYHADATAPRYRLSETEILDIACRLEQDGVHLLDLTMGEDPQYLVDGRLPELVRAVAKETAMPIMVSPGVLGTRELREIRQAGANWYACYQETHDPHLFARLRPGQDYQARMRSKEIARKEGLLVEEGLLLGVGEEAGHLSASMSAMRDIGAAQVRAMTFVPQPGSLMENVAPGPVTRELVMIALLRLAFPHALIPASLDVQGLHGLRSRLDAGANLVTSIIPADCGLGGVANPSLDVVNGHRSAFAVREVLRGMDLRPGTVSEYSRFMAKAVASP